MACWARACSVAVSLEASDDPSIPNSTARSRGCLNHRGLVVAWRAMASDAVSDATLNGYSPIRRMNASERPAPEVLAGLPARVLAIARSLCR
jgi:hypothetical protein